MAIRLTTIVCDVSIFDLGDVIIKHPSVDIDISEFGIDKLRESQSLKQLINENKVVVKNRNNVVISSEMLSLLDFDVF